MRAPNDVLKTQRWIIDDIVHDFDVEDVWALPIDGGPDDFPARHRPHGIHRLPGSTPLPVRLLREMRDLLGRMFGIDTIANADSAVATSWTVALT